jgi:tRNA threonylcarbamoyladenosine dehydratase
MGAGAKSDPTRIQIADISATHYDPLARAVRQRLRATLSRSSRSGPSTTPSDPSTTSARADVDADVDVYSPEPDASMAVHEYAVPVVYSTEVPSDVALLPLAETELARGDVDELAPLRDFRVRILPVLGPLPAIFGLHIATYVLCEIAGRALERPVPVRHRKKLYERMWKDLLHRESRIARKQIKCVCVFLSERSTYWD